MDETTTSYDAAGRVDTVTNLGPDLSSVIGSTTNHYDEGTEHRGLVTSQTLAGVGTFTGSYNADGTLTSQTYPASTSGGTAMTETWAVDPTGDVTGVDYAQGSVDWMSDSQVSNAQGQWAQENGGADAPFTGTQQYAWLGGKQRATEGLAQLITMGARIYAPNLGRFTSTPEPDLLSRTPDLRR